MLFASGYYIIARRGMLQHIPHGLDIFVGISPISIGFHIAQRDVLTTSSTTRYLFCHEIISPAGALMIEEDATTTKHVVCLPIIDRCSVGSQFCYTVWGMRMEGRVF